MEFKLKNKALVELDKRIFELNKRYSLVSGSLGNFPNTFAVSEFVNLADLIIEELEKIKTEDEFEQIFIENSIHNLNAQKTFCLYFSKGGISAEKLLEKNLGKDALKTLKENIEKFDYESLWKFYLSYQEYSYKRIPSDDENIRKKFYEILTNLKKDFLDYIKKEFGFPADYDFDLVLGQPYSDNTFFHPTNRRMEVSPNTFFVFKEGNEIKINSSAVIQVLFHEILGHGMQEVFSRDMPLSMQSNSVNTSVSPLHVHFEGVSQTIEKDSIEFMRMFQKKYEIEEDYIQQRILFVSKREISNFQAFYQYLGLKEIENKSFDVDGEFKKITKNYGLSVLFSSIHPSPLSCIATAVYPIGIHILTELFNEIKKEIGEENFEKNKPKIYRAVVTGVLNFEVLPKFVKLYLREAKVLGK